MITSQACFFRRWFRGFVPVAVLLSAGTAGAVGTNLTLTNVAQVRVLTAEQARESWPVRLSGVVITRADPWEHAAVLADATAGIYLLADNNVFAPYHRGDRLEVFGVTDPGQFAPIVKVNSVRHLGRGEIPPPRPVTYPQLVTGALDAQWVEVSGVVRRFIPPDSGGEVWRVLLAADGGVIPIRGTLPRDPGIKADAEVRVQAVCFYQFNVRRQVLTPVLQVPAGVPVQVVKPAPTDPFDAPVRSADSLLRFSAALPGGHRVHVRGVVTHAQSGSLVWIRDHSSGLRVQMAQAGALRVGDEVDVLGYPAYGPSTPVLEEAIVRQRGVRPPPAPLVLTNLAAAFDHEDDLVETEAWLRDIQPVLEGLVFTFDREGTVFKGVLKTPAGKAELARWLPGSQVRVVGICQVIYDDIRPLMGVWQPQSFQVLLRSAADLAVLRKPSWWTPKHITYVLSAASLGLLLVTGGVMWLTRHRLREQGRRRAMAEAEFAAILAERNRVAREIHDTLAQSLAATSVQLRLARKMAVNDPAGLQHHLDVAQELVGESLEEARNSIWNMRSQVLETNDLPGALNGILKQMADGADLQTHFEVAGRARRLSPVIENNLLRVGQEAITNAFKHARARSIRVDLSFGERQFGLRVRDDGCGFDPHHPPLNSGGFGLMGMRERAAELKGELTLHSAAGEGTEVALTVPLSGE